MYLCILFTLTAVTPVQAGGRKPTGEETDWAIRTKYLQKWQYTDPEQAAADRRRAKFVSAGILAVLLSIRGTLNYDETSFEAGLVLDMFIGGTAAYLVSPYSKKKMYAEQNELRNKLNEGVSFGYIDPSIGASANIEIRKAVRRTTPGIIAYEIMGGMGGPFILFGKSVMLLPKRPETAILLIPSILLWPVSVPYGVYAAGKQKDQGGSFLAAFIGSVAATAMSYSRYRESGAEDYADDSPDEFAYSYGSCILFSVLTYNLFKPSSGIEVDYLGKEASLSPAVYLSFDKSGTNPALNLCLIKYY